MPQISFEINPNQSGVHLFGWHIEESIDFFADIPSQWSMPERTGTKQIESLATRYCLWQLCKQLGIENPTLSYAESGKPYLPNLSISLAHTYPFVVAAVSAHKPIGIDIEKTNRKVQKIGPRFLHTNEWERWKNDQKALTLAWSAKESVYKALDIPGLSFRESIELAEFTSEAMQIEVRKEKLSIHWEAQAAWVLTIALVH